MGTFGSLIDAPQPVLLVFYVTGKAPDDQDLLRISRESGPESRIIKIDVRKNPELAEALRIREFPTYMIYRNGEMCWRSFGFQTPETLVGFLKAYS